MLCSLSHSQHFQLFLVVEEGQLRVLNELRVLAFVLPGTDVDDERQLYGGLVDKGVVSTSGYPVDHKDSHVEGLSAECDHGLDDVDGILQNFLLASPWGYCY